MIGEVCTVVGGNKCGGRGGRGGRGGAVVERGGYEV